MAKRAKREYDCETIEDMASEFCTQEEIALDMGFDVSEFQKNDKVKQAFQRGKNTARMSLRHMMYEGARNGEKALMMFLAKNELQYRDNPSDVKTEDEIPHIIDVRPSRNGGAV